METINSEKDALATVTVNPNALHSQVVLTLMTRQAQRLVYGRRGHADDKQSVSPIIGLFKFAAMMHLIWRGGMRDDPYADLWLARVENTLRLARKETGDISYRVKQALVKVPESIRVGLAAAPEPMRLELRFSNPYTYMGAYLLGDYDRLTRLILTARYVGALPTPEARNELNASGRCVRRAYVAASGYRFLGVTRTDMRVGNNRACLAIRQMGALPENVLADRPRLLHRPTTRPLTHNGRNRPEGTDKPPASEQIAAAN